MQTFKIVFVVATFILFLNGCNNNDNPYNPPVVDVPIDVDIPIDNPPVVKNTEFYDNAVAAFNQDEDDEPLEVSETVDETSSFDALL